MDFFKDNIVKPVSWVLLVTGIMFLVTETLIAQKQNEKPVYKDAKAPVEERVEDLVSRMTLEEKVQQLNQLLLGKNNNPNNLGRRVERVPAEVGSLIYYSTDPVFRNIVQRKAMEESRLGIPIIFGYDVIHGFKTVYPISLAQACSWNTELAKQACSVAASEARLSGVDWTFSPMIDVSRDGRWGRVAEGYGEDPYVNSVFAVASVEGYQGDDMSSMNSVAACLKHYVGYGASEGGRDYVYTEISKQTLWDTYLPPFEAGVKAGAATLMSSFNDISGIPASANHYTLTEILKEKWGHDGFVVSDWWAVMQLERQGIAASRAEATQKAFEAGIEMDMTDKYYEKYLEKLVQEGKVSEERLNDAVKRVLRVKFRLGLFDNPYVPEKSEEKRFLLPENLKKVEKLAEESIVLLKNKDNVLPLKKSLRIGLIGPMVGGKEHMLGSWWAHGEDNDVTGILEAMQAEFGAENISPAKGCDFEGEDASGFAEAVELANKSDVLVLCLGEKRTWSGENASRSTLALPQIQEGLVAELAKLEKPLVVLLTNGRPLDLSSIEPYADAIVEMWQPGVVGGTPVSKVLSGKVNPSGKLAMTFPYSTGQVPIYYNMRPSSRPKHGKYQDIPTEPLYEFTYGLSYTEFEYGEIKVNTEKFKQEDKVSLEIEVKNIGQRDGQETVHWFISDPVCSISRPVKELKFFEKKLIKAGETVVFKFELEPLKDLGFVNSKGDKFIESGDYYIIVKDNKIKLNLE